MRHHVLAVIPAFFIAATAQAASFTQTKITANDTATGAYFGGSVAIYGATAIVSAEGLGDGAVYLFDTSTGKQTAKLTPKDLGKNDLLGTSLGISGATAVVGVSSDKNPDGGAAYVFDTTTGKQTATLTPGDTMDAMDSEMFGTSVAISGTTAIIGATWGRGDDPGHEPLGAAYLFDTTTGKQTAKLTASDTVRTFIGGSVDISGTTAIVGTEPDSTPGAAYLFDTITGKQTAKLVASDGTKSNYFGFSVAISGTIAIVGAQGQDDNRGAAYLFDTTTGKQLAKLVPGDPAKKDRFGRSVAISGTTAMVTGSKNIDSPGAVYLFDTATGAQLAKLTSPSGVKKDFAASSVAISGTTAIIGAQNTSDNGLPKSGAAYIVELD